MHQEVSGSNPRNSKHFALLNATPGRLRRRRWCFGFMPMSVIVVVVSGTAPPDLSELLHLYSPSRFLRSAADTRIFRVPKIGRRTTGERSFQYIGPVF